MCLRLILITGCARLKILVEPARISSKKVSPQVRDAGRAQCLNFSTKYYDPNNSSADAQGNVTETISLGALAESGTLSAKKMASYFNNEFKQLNSVNVRATAHNQIKVQSLDSVSRDCLSIMKLSRMRQLPTSVA